MRHTPFQARFRQVIQPVWWEFQSLDDFHLGKPQVLNLPFQCVEGDYATCWGSWAMKGTEKVANHKQCQKCISIRLVSVNDWLAQVAKQGHVVYGNADDNDVCEEEEEEEQYDSDDEKNDGFSVD